MSKKSEKSGEEYWKKIIRQNEVIISLLGRLAFGEERVKEIVVHDKRRDLRQGYIKGYNACDGKHSLSEIAKIIGVKAHTLSPIMASWEEIGIIYEVERRGGKFYKKLFPI